MRTWTELPRAHPLCDRLPHGIPAGNRPRAPSRRSETRARGGRIPLSGCDAETDHRRRAYGPSGACRRTRPGSVCGRLSGDLGQAVGRRRAHPAAPGRGRGRAAGRLRQDLGARRQLRSGQGVTNNLDGIDRPQPGDRRDTPASPGLDRGGARGARGGGERRRPLGERAAERGAAAAQGNASRGWSRSGARWCCSPITRG